MTTQAQLVVRAETHGLRYKPVIVRCSKIVDPKIRKNIVAVSLVKGKCDKAVSSLYVHKREQPWKPKHNFTMCSVPFYLGFNDVTQLIQYIEVNGVFGADHFIFYNYSSNSVLKPYLHYYSGIGVADVIPWKLPIYGERGKGSVIHFYGQLISLNDCILRAMLTSRYVASLDTDEVLLPLKQRDWLSLLLSYKNYNHTAGYIFANTFFRKTYQQNSKFKNNSFIQQHPILPLLITTRDKKSLRHGDRSKFIGRPEAIIISNIHYPSKTERGYKNFNIPPADAISAHYRQGIGNSGGEINETRVLQFSAEIMKRVEVVVKAVNGSVTLN